MFVCLTVVSIVVIYFFYPETNQRSLEELAAYFGETVLVETDLNQDKAAGETGGAEKSAVERSERAQL